MAKVTNTTAVAASDPVAGLVMGLPGAIEASEARGQRELVRSSVVPADMRGQRELFEALGFRFGELVDGDPIFVHAELPPGWSKAPTDHSMWSSIVDDRGRVRVNVFYKAAFYDRSASMSLERRYDVTGIYPDGDFRNRAGVAVVDKATGEHIWTGGQESWSAADAWLDANLPDHRDVVAAWKGA